MNQTARAYWIRFNTHTLLLCLRCARTFTGDKEPVTTLPLMNKCHKCSVTILRKTEER